MVLLLLIIVHSSLTAQIPLEYLGLRNYQLTDIGLNYGIIAAGTDRQGVYWQTTVQPFDTSWHFIGLDSAEVHAVYPHKSGPLGWAVGAGLRPECRLSAFCILQFHGQRI